MAECVIHWFRRDLRLMDNSALDAALRSGDPVLPVFILDEAILSHDIDPRRLSLLRAALEDLDRRLGQRGSRLLVRRGDAARELNRVAEEAKAWGVYLNRDHTPYARQRDARATRGLQMTGVVTQTFDDLMLVSPQLMVDAAGLPPADFDDFSRAWLEQLDVDPTPPAVVEGTFMSTDAPDSIDDWADSLAPPAEQPDAPADASVWQSLVLGTKSVREVARAVLARAAADESSREGAEAFILDLCHREHAYHLLHAHPEALGAPGPEGDYVRHWLLGNRLT